MISSKYISKLAAFIMLLAFAVCTAAVIFADRIKEVSGGEGVKMEYEDRLFDTSDIISINIIMSDADWDDMIKNAISENYYKCDVDINGTRFYNVGIRPKGNTSLSNIVSDPDTDRYSFKLEFGHFTAGQTCWGLDKLILNNNYADATSMKEAVAYDMFQYLGADASLYNYADISVNGEYWGLYLALEAVESSFIMRNYGAENGELYKPDPMGMNNMGEGEERGFGDKERGGMRGRHGENHENMPEDFTPPDIGNMPEDFTPPDMENMPEDFTFPDGGDREDRGGFGGTRGSGTGADLNYSDDDLDSYSSIWESSIKNTTKKDHKRVVKALKNISEGKNIEKYMDVDNLLRYMAVHSFLVNQDSLSGNMAHNYYLYESGGRLNIIPWDYNLAFGGMGMGRNGSGAASTVNDAIDTPFDGTDFFDCLLENEEYLEKYHQYYRQLVDGYVNGGVFDEVYDSIVSRISDSIKADPTAFYTYDEFEEAHKVLYNVVKLRAQSVSGQLDGTIPSTDEEQKNSDALVDASDINLSVMGQMMGGGPEKDAANGENGERRGMRPGGMAPQKTEEKKETDISSGKTVLMLCGAAMFIGLVLVCTFKRRKKLKEMLI